MEKIKENKKTILSICWGYSGHLTSILCICEELVQRGHKVYLASYKNKFEKWSAEALSKGIIPINLEDPIDDKFDQEIIPNLKDVVPIPHVNEILFPFVEKAFLKLL
jgi:hypothetical protein